MANGENTAAAASDTPPVKTASARAQREPGQRKPRTRKQADDERAARAAERESEATSPTEQTPEDDQESLANAAETLASRLGVMAPPGVDHAFGASRQASMATIRAHRLVVEFHLGQLERTLRAGRALTSCRSFEDAVEVHRGFMEETLRASATHLRDLAAIGLGTRDKSPQE